jgi:hypothetical protein
MIRQMGKAREHCGWLRTGGRLAVAARGSSNDGKNARIFTSTLPMRLNGIFLTPTGSAAFTDAIRRAFDPTELWRVKAINEINYLGGGGGK